MGFIYIALEQTSQTGQAMIMFAAVLLYDGLGLRKECATGEEGGLGDRFVIYMHTRFFRLCIAALPCNGCLIIHSVVLHLYTARLISVLSCSTKQHKQNGHAHFDRRTGLNIEATMLGRINKSPKSCAFRGLAHH